MKPSYSICKDQYVSMRPKAILFDHDLQFYEDHVVVHSHITCFEFNDGALTGYVVHRTRVYLIVKEKRKGYKCKLKRVY